MNLRRLLLIACALFVAIPVSAQTSGTSVPFVAQQYFDNNGDPCAACKLYFYVAGTTTPLDSFSDSALSTANANPVVLDSAGRATIFLSAALYKLVLQTAAGATLWSRDNIAADVGFTSIDNSTMDGRITCLSATPVGDTNGLSSTSMFLVPYKGNRIALYFGSTWRIFTFSEVSVSIAGDAGSTVYDLFAYVSSVSGTVTLERVAWASATVRAVGISLQDGVYVKSGDATRRYLGTYRKDIAGVLDDPNKRFVWNYYNRVTRALRVIDATDSWTYTTAAFRQANGSTANQVAIVVGVAEVLLDLRAIGIASNTNAIVSTVTSIGEDSTTIPVAGVIGMVTDSPAANAKYQMSAAVSRQPAIGYHFYAWLEYSNNTGTTTWSGDAGFPTQIQSGLTGSIVN
jgi:hypothetical protein